MSSRDLRQSVAAPVPRTYEEMCVGLPPRSLFVLSLSNPLRMGAVMLVKSRYFDRFILMLIIVNCMFLTMDSKALGFESSSVGKVVALSENVFTGAYVLEMMVKIVAMGFWWDKGSYLSDWWNRMDFTVVVLGLLAYLPGVGNFSGMRTVRVLRPLRTITGVSGMRALVKTLLQSLPLLFDVLVLVSFLFFIFGIIGVQLFESRLRNRCGELYNPVSGCEGCGNEAVSGFANCPTTCALPANPDWIFDDSTDDLCSGVMAETYPNHGTGGSGLKCPMGQYCAWEERRNLPNFGITSFDNMGWAWLTIFQCISMEGWTEVMYHTMDAVSVWSWVYYVLIIILGSFFAVNLALAVLYVHFVGANAVTHDLERRKEQEVAAAEKAAMIVAGNDAVTDEIPLPGKTGLVGMMHKLAVSQQFEYLTTAMICINTVAMAAEYNGMPQLLKDILEWVNIFLFSYFVVEMIIKIIGFGPIGYVKDRMNIFDGFVVLISAVEVVLRAFSSGDGDNNLSIMRSFRLLRVFKLARSWKQLNEIITTMVRSLAGISYLSLILLLFMFIFALLGMQLFGYEFVFCTEYGLDVDGGAKSTCPAGMIDECPKHFDCYAPCDASLVGQWVTFDDSGAGGLCQMYSGDKFNPSTRTTEHVNAEYLARLGRGHNARHNFDDIFWSFVTIFQVLTGENWNVVMYDGIREVSTWASLYFILLVVVGNYIILNLFLAILLDNFAMWSGDDEDSTEAANSVGSLPPSLKSSRQPSMHKNGNGPAESNGTDDDFSTKVQRYNSFLMDPNARISVKKKLDRPGYVYGKYVEALKHRSLFIFSPTNPVRLAIAKLVYHRWFEYFMIVIILLSSIVLAIDSPEFSADLPLYSELDSTKAQMKVIMDLLDVVFLFLFVGELILKVIVRGFIMHKGSYMRSAWNVLDFIIVAVGLVAFTVELNSRGKENLTAARALRTFRALRPLRVASRAPGMKVVVQALFLAIPGITNVMFVCLLFYLIFGILGLNLFMGKMYFCADITEREVQLVPERMGIADSAMNREWCRRDAGWHFNYCPVASDPLYGNRNTFSHVMDMPVAEGDPWTCIISDAGTTFSPTFTSRMGGTHGAEWTCTPGNATVTKYGSTDHFVSLAAANSSYSVTSMCEPKAYNTVWTNPRDYNFDNIGNSVLALFEIVTLENWLVIMYHGADMTGVGTQPVRDTDKYYCLFFIAFIIVGSFFVMNLFVGVTIDKFNEMKEAQQGRSIFLTPEQENWVQIQKIIAWIRPKKNHLRPSMGFRRVIFDFVTTDEFDTVILTLIASNILVMAMVHADMTEAWTNALFIANSVFAGVFLMEALLKLVAFGILGYFKDAWNRFDFFVVCLSVAGFVITIFTEVSASYLSLLRVARVARIFRLIPKAKGLKALFQTLLYSLPALGNVGSVLFLFFFIFAVLGMNLFGKMRFSSGELSRYANFETFGFSMLTLFRMATGEAWNGIMHDTMIQSDCVLVQDPATGNLSYVDYDAVDWDNLDKKYWTNQCSPHTFISVAYFCLFILLCAFVMLNLVIAVILDNFQSTSKDFECPVSKHDMENFVEVWSRLDPKATYYIPATKLERLVMSIQRPLGVKGMNAAALRQRCQEIIMSVEIPNRKGELHFLEVLHALSGRVAGTDLPLEEEEDIRNKIIDRLPTFNEKKGVPKYTAAHVHAALFVQAAVRGFLARYQMREEVKAAKKASKKVLGIGRNQQLELASNS